MANNYDQRLEELINEYEQYLDEHGGRVLLRPDITIRLDFLNHTQLANRALLEFILVQLGGEIPVPPPSPPGPEPPIEITVKTKWEAGEPEQIFNQAILATGTFYGNKMIDWRQGKRVYFFIQSTLNQPVQAQVIGNIADTKDGATSLGSMQICPANDNISLGPTWEQWCPYLGVKIVVGTAPTAGILTISAVKQE